MSRQEPSAEASFLSRKSAADRLDVSLKTLDALISDGTLPAIRLRTLVRIPADALEELLRKHRIEPSKGEMKTSRN